MAYIRCGGGGIPATLKSDMNAVFNKKFETSTTYPPNTWADTVNLMGALPERTASGTIATFNDGADLVPLKSLTLTVTPSQSGTGDPSPSNPRPLNSFSSLTIEHTKKNLFDLNIFDVTGITIENGIATGTATSFHQAFRYGVPNLKFSNGQMTLTMSAYTDGNASTSSTGLRTRIFYTDGTNSTLEFLNSDTTKTTKSVTTTAGKVIDYMTISYASTGSNIWHVSEVQLECGTTATAYEPYHLEQHTLDLGSTVYGLTGDCVSGEFEETYGVVDLSSFEWQYESNYSRFKTTTQLSDVKTSENNNTPINGICSIFKLMASNNTASSSYDNVIGVSTGKIIQIRDTSLNGDINALMALLSGQKLCYELATPSELTTDPVEVESFKGVNNIWCDKDNSSVAVEYRADIDLLITELGG